jgi:hypothetical protein
MGLKSRVIRRASTILNTALKPGASMASLDETILSTTAHSQVQSSFLARLPLEVRRQIYREIALDLGAKIHLHAPQERKVQRRDGRIPGVKRPPPTYHYQPIRHIPCMMEIGHAEFKPRDGAECCTHWKCHRLMEIRLRSGQIWVPSSMDQQDGSASGPSNVLIAMKTCKQMYGNSSFLMSLSRLHRRRGVHDMICSHVQGISKQLTYYTAHQPTVSITSAT